jgi:N-6 DNA Methylase
MTDGNQATEEPAVNAQPRVSEDVAGPPTSLTLRLSQERYRPLIEQISLQSEIARQLIGQLSCLHGNDAGGSNPWLALWREHCSQYFDLDAAEALLAGNVNSPTGTRLFLGQSFCRLVLDEFVALGLGMSRTSRPAGLYDWVNALRSVQLDALRRDLRHKIASSAEPARLNATDCSDLLAAIYQEIFPPPLRHLLGEYYTPSWLVEHCIQKTLSHVSEIADEMTILDPAAGSGSFLVRYITRLAAAPRAMPATVVGFDVNPLAVDFCRANVLMAMSKARINGAAPTFKLRIHLADAIVDPVADSISFRPGRPGLSGWGPGGSGPDRSGAFQRTILGAVFSRDNVSDADLDAAIRPFRLPPATREAFLGTLRQYVSDAFAATRAAGAHVIVGNPPWIAWDGLMRGYRDGLAPQWAASALMVSKGWRAKVAAGKTDVSSLFVYRAAARHAAANAVMAFVLPLSLFQSHLSGAGFRTFRTANGRHFALVALDDFSAVKVFPDAVNRTSVGAFAVDRSQQFPVRYTTWSPSGPEGRRGELTGVSSPGGPLAPSDPASPIVAFRTHVEMIAGKSDYRARGGVNTGGANAILWLEVLAREGAVGQSNLIQVRNVGKSRRSSSPVYTADIERDAVWPLLRGADMQRWRAAPGRSILLLYSPDQPKKALPVTCAQSTLPKAYAFASRFRQQLEGRREYHRWGGAGPF